jgi:uncharacterized protein (TIGR03437 family)
MQPDSSAAAVNAATFEAGTPVAPGSLVSVFGPFTGSQTGGAAGFPLTRKIGETEVFVDGKAVPLLYVSPGQVNFQMPASTAAGQSLAEVRVGGQVAGRAAVTVLPTAPGLFAVANENGTPNSSAAPARGGQVLQIFGTGQGAVVPSVDDGAAASGRTSSLVMPNVYLRDRQLQVQYSGLAPGYAGVWQINALLPPDAPTGSTVDLMVVSGLASNKLSVAIAQ